MPLISVKVDGFSIAAISTDGLEAVTINVGGACIEDEYADLTASGGIYSGSTADHRIWVDHVALRAGQVVEVDFLELGTPNGDYRAAANPTRDPGDPIPSYGFDLFAEARTAPRLRSGYRVRLTRNEGDPITLTTNSDDHGFGFHILWNKMRPGNVSVSLESYSLESVESETAGRGTFRERVKVGSNYRLELLA